MRGVFLYFLGIIFGFIGIGICIAVSGPLGVLLCCAFYFLGVCISLAATPYNPKIQPTNKRSG